MNHLPLTHRQHTVLGRIYSFQCSTNEDGSQGEHRMSIANGAKELGIDRDNMKKDLQRLTELGFIVKSSNGERGFFDTTRRRGGVHHRGTANRPPHEARECKPDCRRAERDALALLDGHACRCPDRAIRLDWRGVWHKHTRPRSPWQDGRVERVSQTPAREWRRARAWGSGAAGADAPGAFVDHLSWDRPHGACGGLPPMSRIDGVDHVMVHNS